MARRAQPISVGLWVGAAAAALILMLTLGTLGAVMHRAGSFSGFGPADWAAIRFTLLQASLSALISVALAIPVARALARRQFPGRGLLITLLGAPFILPVIVAILGLLAVFGRNGLLNIALSWAGIEPVSIYGLQGVLVAHVFFNLPLATRLILQGWLSIPSERFRLAASLNFRADDVNRLLGRPMLRAVVPGALVVIFVICMTSFAVALTLGGGPRSTTVELAIYQAFRFDFDLGHAALLSVVQFGLSALAAVLAAWIAVPGFSGAGLDRPVLRWDARRGWLRALDALWIGLAALFLLLPLGMVVGQGVASLFSLPPQVFGAALRSVLVAVGSACLMLALALPLSVAAVRAGRLFEVIGTLAIAASPLVIGTGLFILLRPVADPVALALPVTALVNAVMSLPFALRALLPALREVEATYGHLADSLGMRGWARLRLLLVPRLRRPIGFSMGLAAALSMGDLGVIALFADPSQATLPLQLYRLMGSYRLDQAAGAALLLLGLSLALFWLFDRGGRVNADA
ncbi:thiamine/thiamine pyrophosphate ABC transporter permease ThiP [Actibacterium sp. XHP0104]|uniref:thiamine/thiamine pyrophosphate ABC transporter permease ThiP n=1 Tax=Actibacterium sp. XHP0104 TaxID=2984335 RepID=UPI0021E72061|nr:thiamine/thiamine pyrophosphate ABC transporter permease ThiP [Actibacterium sp. XHP0104]MCV2882005.1 thiamine/thiamine pyrophosphate ABC transporter permease ThiP [Actibacterium sp. XHP0104]